MGKEKKQFGGYSRFFKRDGETIEAIEAHIGTLNDMGDMKYFKSEPLRAIWDLHKAASGRRKRRVGEQDHTTSMNRIRPMAPRP